MTVAALAAMLAALVLTAAAAPAVAGASGDIHSLVQGKAGHPFRLTAGRASAGLAYTGGQTITLRRGVLWSSDVQGSGSSTGWGSVQWLSDGSRLVCTGGEVEWLGAGGNLEWSCTHDNDPTLQSAAWAWEYQAGDGHHVVIIADSSAGSVFTIDTDGATPHTPGWTYTGSGAYRLSKPVGAEYVARGTTDGLPSVLIADADPASPKVLEIGLAQKSVEWSYGTPAVGAGQLTGPTDVERESDGSTLIADAASDRVIEVAKDGRVWTYGGAGVLSDPMGVGVASDGDWLIADTGHGRVIEVDPSDDRVVWSSSKLTGAADVLGQPRLAERASGAPATGLTAKVDGALLVCDVSGEHLALIGNGGGGNIYSKTLRLTSGGTQAHWLSLRVDADRPAGTKAGVYYTPSSGVPSQDPLVPGLHSLRGVVSNTVKLNFWLTSSDRWIQPSLDDVVLTYTTGQTKSSASGNGGATNSNGTASGSGTGTGNGVGGSGSGSGTGAGQGTSTDLGGGGTAGTSGSTSQTSGADLVVPSSQQAATSTGTAGAVSGVPVSIGDVSGGALGGGGGSPPPPVSHTAARLQAAAAVALLACLLIGPSIVVRRRMRRLGAWEHKDELEGWA